MTQTQLAEALGTTQASVSRWESSTDPALPDFDEMRAIEDLLGASRGAILVAAGLVDVPAVEAAILADPSLDATELELLLRVYRSVAVKGTSAGKRRKGGTRDS